jgi:hypothetical protein
MRVLITHSGMLGWSDLAPDSLSELIAGQQPDNSRPCTDGDLYPVTETKMRAVLTETTTMCL